MPYMKIKLLGSSPDKWFGILFGLIASALFVYEVLRAARISITFDEAATYMSYLSSSVFAVFDLRAANNHFLYTFLARLSGIFAGSSELSLRLPSLLGYLLYLGSSWAILNRFFGRFMALSGFLFLNLNPFVLDYFSLGRGYGLSLGFEMAALYFCLVFLDSRRQAQGEGNRALAMSLLLAFASALANLSFLNVLMSFWVFVFLFFLIKNLIYEPQHSATPPRESGGARSRLVSAAVALSIPFNLIVIGQCIRLSERAMDPVFVRVHGPQEEAIGNILVSGIDLYDNEIPFTFQNGAWVPPKTIYLKRLKLGFAAPALVKLQDVDIEIGARRLRFSRPEIRKWKHLADGDLQYFLLDTSVAARKSLFRDMSGLINWRGDGIYVGAYVREAARVYGIFALLLGLLYGLAWLTVRLRLLRAGQFRPISDSACLAILYLFYPIYSMNQNQAFYYGGQDGFFKDTFYSLIGDSFYGVGYAASQERIIFFFMLGSITFSLLLLGWRLRKKDLSEHPETFSILAIMTIISLLVIAQRALFGIPHLMGRTAIFFIPLSALFLLFLLRDLWHFRGAWRAAAIVILTLIAGFSSYHWIRTANLTHTMEWYSDSDTRAMIKDVTSLKAQTLSNLPRIRLGVDWLFWPSSVYYRRRNHLSWLDVYMLPVPRDCDCYYLSRNDRRIGSMSIIKRYPRSGNALVQ
jgi:hypothetical protein